MQRCKIPKLTTIMAVIACCIAGGRALAAGQCMPMFGITLSHYQVDSGAACKNGREAAQVLAQGAIIPQYDDPAVRAKVRSILEEAKTAGYSVIRMTVWFTADRIIAPWGQLAMPLSPEDARRIQTYGEDIRAAGFRKLLVVLNPGVRNSPLCKRVTFGDCWDRSRERANLQFIGAVHATLVQLTSPTFEVDYDISGELCPSRYLPSVANDNIDSYVTHLITWYSHSISATDFHISCGGLGDDREALLLGIYDRAGVKPNIVDMHLYDEDKATIDRKLLPAIELAKRRSLPIMIGELHYESVLESAGIAELAHANGVCFSEMIEWPLKGKTLCQININPPFSPRVLRSAMDGSQR